MAIGIIVNPASGKDIRRLVSQATLFDNREKVNIAKRVILGAHAMGVEDFLLMPGGAGIGAVVLNQLEEAGTLPRGAKLLDMPTIGSVQDTTTAARMLEAAGASCVVALGGDGTSRAASKELRNTAILPISTGTNNVYPIFIEGTSAGICAGVVDRLGNPARTCVRDKRIEIYIDGELRDIALVDAVVSAHFYAGARAIWNMDEILAVLAIRAHPANIGFSSIVGCVQTVRAEDDCGYITYLSERGDSILAPVAPGIVAPLKATRPERIDLGNQYDFTAERDCMIALDGEREVKLKEGQTATFLITRNGPWRVNVRETMELAQREGFFHGEKI